MKDIKQQNVMQKKIEGYAVKKFSQPTKRYCQTLDLRNDPQLIAAYKHLHSQEHVWSEILDGIKKAGVLEMEIYLLGTRLFMIVELPYEANWDDVMNRMANYPRQAEWESLTAKYQEASAHAASSEKWKMMERIFYLYK